MRLLATIDDRAVIHKILSHVRLPGARDGPRLPSAISVVQAVQPALPGVTL